MFDTRVPRSRQPHLRTPYRAASPGAARRIAQGEAPGKPQPGDAGSTPAVVSVNPDLATSMAADAMRYVPAGSARDDAAAETHALIAPAASVCPVLQDRVYVGRVMKVDPRRAAPGRCASRDPLVCSHAAAYRHHIWTREWRIDADGNVTAEARPRVVCEHAHLLMCRACGARAAPRARVWNAAAEAVGHGVVQLKGTLKGASAAAAAAATDEHVGADEWRLTVGWKPHWRHRAELLRRKPGWARARARETIWGAAAYPGRDRIVELVSTAYRRVRVEDIRQTEAKPGWAREDSTCCSAVVDDCSCLDERGAPTQMAALCRYL